MKNIILLIGSIFCLSLTLNIQSKDTLPTYILLKGATIIDCISGESRKGDLLIKQQKIEKISFGKTITAPKGTITYDLTKGSIFLF